MESLSRAERERNRTKQLQKKSILLIFAFILILSPFFTSFLGLTSAEEENEVDHEEYIEESESEKEGDVAENDPAAEPSDGLETPIQPGPAPESDFEWEDRGDGTAMITKYIGNNQRVIIPHTLGGLTVAVIGQEAFTNKNLSSVSIPETVFAIGPLAFSNNDLVSIVLPENLEIIAHMAFAINQITSVTIPEKTKEIIGGVFALNPLNAIIVYENNNHFEVYGGDTLIKRVGDQELHLVQGSKSTGIIEGTTHILPMAFMNLGLTGDLILPNTVESVAEMAFANAVEEINPNNFNRVVIPSSVKEIDNGAFASLSINSLQLNEGLEKVGAVAFANNSLKKLELPSTLNTIGLSAFINNELEQVLIRNQLFFAQSDIFAGNQENHEDLLIRGFYESQVPRYAEIFNYSFKPYSRVIVDADQTQRFYPEEMMEIYTTDGLLEGVLYVPFF